MQPVSLESCVVSSPVPECEICVVVDEFDVDFVARFLHFHVDVRPSIWIGSTLLTVMVGVKVFAFRSSCAMFSFMLAALNNNNDFFSANILEGLAQWRDKTKGLSKLVIENNALVVNGWMKKLGGLRRIGSIKEIGF